MVKRIVYRRGDDFLLMLAIGILILLAMTGMLRAENSKDTEIKRLTARISELTEQVRVLTAQQSTYRIGTAMNQAAALTCAQNLRRLTTDNNALKVANARLVAEGKQVIEETKGKVEAGNRTAKQSLNVSTDNAALIEFQTSEFAKWKRQFIIMQIIYMSTQILVALIILAISRRHRA